MNLKLYSQKNFAQKNQPQQKQPQKQEFKPGRKQAKKFRQIKTNPARNSNKKEKAKKNQNSKVQRPCGRFNPPSNYRIGRQTMANSRVCYADNPKRLLLCYFRGLH
jgi:hypothetical protein